MEIIKENWSEIERVEELVREQKEDPKAGFNANLFFFGGVRQLLIPVKYRGMKGKKDNRVFTDSYKEISIAAKYCPFSGKPLYNEKNTEDEN